MEGAGTDPEHWVVFHLQANFKMIFCQVFWEQLQKIRKNFGWKRSEETEFTTNRTWRSGSFSKLRLYLGNNFSQKNDKRNTCSKICVDSQYLFSEQQMQLEKKWVKFFYLEFCLLFSNPTGKIIWHGKSYDTCGQSSKEFHNIWIFYGYHGCKSLFPVMLLLKDRGDCSNDTYCMPIKDSKTLDQRKFIEAEQVRFNPIRSLFQV